MGIMQEAIGITHPMVPLPFTLANLAAGQDGTAVPATANGNYWVVPWGGYIVGMGVFSNAAVTANTVTFKPTVNGTESAVLSVQLDTTNTQHHQGHVPAIGIPFSEGAYLGVVYDSHASFTPTTADVNVVLFVVFNEVRY